MAQIPHSPAFDDALQNAGHALMTDDPVRSLVRVLTHFRDEYRAEVLAAAGVAPATDQTGLRDRIADALARHYDGQHLADLREEHAAHHTEAADAVLAVLRDQQTAIRAAALQEAAEALGRMDYDTDSNDYGYDTYRDAWNGGVMDGAELLRRMAGEEQA